MILKRLTKLEQRVTDLERRQESLKAVNLKIAEAIAALNRRIDELIASAVPAVQPAKKKKAARKKA